MELKKITLIIHPKTTKTMKRVDLKKILYMDFLIRHKCTGTSKEFAAKMDMSRSTLFEYIAYMRDELEVCILSINS